MQKDELAVAARIGGAVVSQESSSRLKGREPAAALRLSLASATSDRYMNSIADLCDASKVGTSEREARSRARLWRLTRRRRLTGTRDCAHIMIVTCRSKASFMVEDVPRWNTVCRWDIGSQLELRMGCGGDGLLGQLCENSLHQIETFLDVSAYAVSSTFALCPMYST